MPLKSGMFTAKEREFIKTMSDTGNAVYAAYQAGYANPETRGPQLANNALVMEECRRQNQFEIATVLVPLALKRHTGLLSDPKTPPGVLQRSIDSAYKHGLVKPEEGFSKDPADMTPEELTTYRDQVVRRLAELAKPVIEGESTPVAPSAPNPFD